VPNVLTAEILRQIGIPTDQFNASYEILMRAGTDRLMTLQRPAGGWGWFDNDTEDPFMTACAVHGLSECARLGFRVDAVTIKRGRERLAAMAREEKDLNRLAYEAYASGGETDRLLAAKEKLSPYALALLALTLHKAGRPEATEAARALAAAAKDDHWETADWHNKWDNVSIETTAYAIQALAAIDPENALIPKAADWLLSQRQGNRWRSTKDTATAIAALLRVTSLETLAGAVGAEGGPASDAALPKKVLVRLGTGDPREILVDLNNPLKSRFEAHFPAVGPGPQAISFEKGDPHSDFRFDVELALQVLDQGPAARVPSGLIVRVEYDRPLDSLRLGDEVTVTLTVSSPEPADYVMAISPIPAGTEVVRGSGDGDFARFEERYEKAIFFLRSLDGTPRELRYRMRCSFAGKYTVLPAWAGLMYNEEIHGTGGGTSARIAP
jgi:hypothetical protein